MCIEGEKVEGVYPAMDTGTRSMSALFKVNNGRFRPSLHGNGSKRNRTHIGADRRCIYTGTDRTVPYRTAIRTKTGPPRK